MTWIIYMVTGPTGKRYVGKSTKSIERRWRQHVLDAKRPRTYLHNAINKYGAVAFTMVVVTECVDQREANACERGLIAQEGTFAPRGYNMTSGGDGVTGWKLSAELRAKLSAMRTGKKFGPRSAEAKAKMRAAKLGRKLTPEHRAKIGAGGKGKSHGSRSAEWVAKQKVSQAQRWADMAVDDPRRAETAARMKGRRSQESYVEGGLKVSKTKQAIRARREAFKLGRSIMASIVAGIEKAKLLAEGK